MKEKIIEILNRCKSATEYEGFDAVYNGDFEKVAEEIEKLYSGDMHAIGDLLRREGHKMSKEKYNEYVDKYNSYNPHYKLGKL